MRFQRAGGQPEWVHLKNTSSSRALCFGALLLLLLLLPVPLLHDQYAGGSRSDPAVACPFTCSARLASRFAGSPLGLSRSARTFLKTEPLPSSFGASRNWQSTRRAPLRGLEVLLPRSEPLTNEELYYSSVFSFLYLNEQ